MRREKAEGLSASDIAAARKLGARAAARKASVAASGGVWRNIAMSPRLREKGSTEKTYLQIVTISGLGLTGNPLSQKVDRHGRRRLCCVIRNTGGNLRAIVAPPLRLFGLHRKNRGSSMNR